MSCTSACLKEYDASFDVTPFCLTSSAAASVSSAELIRLRIRVFLPERGAREIGDVLARVREAANWTLSTQTASLAPVAPAGPGGRLPYATEASLDPYSGFEPRIIPENSTLLPKTASQITGGSNANERTIIAKKSDNVVSIMRELGATPEEAKQIASALASICRSRRRQARARDPSGSSNSRSPTRCQRQSISALLTACKSDPAINFSKPEGCPASQNQKLDSIERGTALPLRLHRFFSRTAY